jgi:putative phosphoribosyl transferase
MAEDSNVHIVAGGTTLDGILTVPHNASGLVVFVHGAGSSRLSPRNGYVATVLNESGFATLLFDLLTESEDRHYANRFDIELLTERLTAVIAWVRTQPTVRDLPLALFGASTGAAAAIRAAAELGPQAVACVISRGGRPDLAGPALRQVEQPVLLIVGGADPIVVGLNGKALQSLGSTDKRLTIVEGATHLFEEPGTLEEVAALARDWLVRRLARVSAAR